MIVAHCDDSQFRKDVIREYFLTGNEVQSQKKLQPVSVEPLLNSGNLLLLPHMPPCCFETAPHLVSFRFEFFRVLMIAPERPQRSRLQVAVNLRGEDCFPLYCAAECLTFSKSARIVLSLASSAVVLVADW